MRLEYFCLILGVIIGVSESEIATNEKNTKFEIPGVLIEPPKNQQLKLECNYTGEHYKNDATPVYDYKWFRDGDALTVTTKYKINVDGPVSTLTIENADVNDAGNYTCKLNDQEQATLRVFMYPTIEHMDRSKNQVQGDQLTLICKARGYPTPKVTWLKDKLPLETDERMELHEVDKVEHAKLVIKNLDYKDKGTYTCKATAENVTKEVEITVHVKDKYAALWPFLGICAEVAILCTIIFIYEKRRTKPEFEDDDDKKEASSHRK